MYYLQCAVYSLLYSVQRGHPGLSLSDGKSRTSHHCAVYSVQFAVWCVQYVVCSIQYTVYSTQYTVHRIHYTIYSIEYRVYNIQYTVYSVKYTLYSIQYTVYSIQYTVKYSTKCSVQYTTGLSLPEGKRRTSHQSQEGDIYISKLASTSQHNSCFIVFTE